MEQISFDKLYNTEFFLSEVLAKPQYWAARGNVYNAIGRPKISHTLLWFKNCSATIRDSLGNVLPVRKNQLTYMAKGLEYIVHFHDTNPDREDTVVIHFQMTDRFGRDISACNKPMVCFSDVDPTLAVSIQALVQECKNNMVCTPALYGELYKILALICQKQKRHRRIDCKSPQPRGDRHFRELTANRLYHCSLQRFCVFFSRIHRYNQQKKNKNSSLHRIEANFPRHD
jgi:hypothetical protein